MKKLFLTTIICILSFIIKAQCNLTIAELQKVCVMDTAQFRSYAMKNGMKLFQEQDNNIFYVCSKDISVSFNVYFKDGNGFHYEFPDKKWYDSLFDELSKYGYKLKHKGMENFQFVNNYESKNFILNLIANDGGSYDVNIMKKK